MKFARRITSLIILVGNLPSALALAGWPSQGTIVQGSATQFDETTWEQNLAQPNATGNFSITGFDISEVFPSEQIDGWKLSINVTSSIPESQTLNPTNNSKVYTGTSIYLKAPQSIVSFENTANVDETTWKICVTVIDNGAEEDASTADNGTCSSLSSQCITDLQDAYADAFAKQQDCYKQPAIPSSCGSSLNLNNMTTQQFPLNNADGKEIFVTGSDAHDASDNSDFDSAARKVWPVLTVWGWNIRANASDATKPTVQLTCARADSVQPGSNVSPSTALASQSSAVVALLISGLVAVLLL